MPALLVDGPWRSVCHHQHGAAVPGPGPAAWVRPDTIPPTTHAPHTHTCTCTHAPPPTCTHEHSPPHTHTHGPHTHAHMQVPRVLHAAWVFSSRMWYRASQGKGVLLQLWGGGFLALECGTVRTKVRGGGPSYCRGGRMGGPAISVRLFVWGKCFILNACLTWMDTAIHDMASLVRTLQIDLPRDWANLALHRDVWRGVVSRC